MTQDPTPTPADRRLDEMTAALRAAGGREAEALPPEVRRSTLEALWVADANRYESRAARNTKLAKYAAILVAAAVVLAIGGTFTKLAIRAFDRRNDPQRNFGIVRNATPPPATTHPATTNPATTQAVAENGVTTPGPVGPFAVTGRAVFLGVPPKPYPINTSATPECRYGHGPLLDDSLVVAEGGGLANVVVSVEPTDGSPYSGPSLTTPAVLDQKGCQFIPHVLAVMVGQPITVKNSDPFLHNVHSLASDNFAFNFGQPNKDPGRKVPPMKVAERFLVRCDVHPWMRAYVNAFNHPYFAVSTTAGSYAIPGQLPDGDYVVTAWHEKFGEKRATVVVKNGALATADFVFDAAALGE